MSDASTLNISSEQAAEIPVPPVIITQGQPPKLKFNGSDKFLRELRKRVDAYFERTGKKRRDVPAMYLKTAIVLGWYFGAYLLLLLVVAHWYTAVPLAILLGLALAGIGFNIQHDAGHKAYSDHTWLNRLMAFSLDLAGGSSYLWDWKHNTIHHTYPNIAGYDDDIDIGFLGRLAPEQKRYSFHRFQGVYLWFLYGFLAIKWHLVDDFYQLFKGRIAGHRVPRPAGRNLVVFILGKVVFFSMAFIIPLMLHKWYAVLGVYAIAAFTSGVVMSVVFQLAHCVGEAQFPVPHPGGENVVKMDTEWAVHQVQTTVDFARGNWLLCWFLGGLNFQVEHHLFSRICHIHYPALSKVVEEACHEFGLKYAEHKSFLAAIRSHAQWLILMGQPDSGVAV